MANINREESSIGINYFEYNVEKKPDKKTKIQRFGIVLLDIVLAIVLFATIDGMLLVISFCGFALVFAIITFFLYKRTQIEYEYIVNSGMYTMSKIYGGRSRKDLFSVKVSSFEIIKPYTESELNTYMRDGKGKVYTCVSSPDAMDIFFAVFKDENNENCAVIFEAPRKALQILRFYNSKALQIR